jgi:5,10-methylenetetrahydromethanopterin reductase
MFGVELHEYLDARTVLAEVRLAEHLGYDAVWLGDSQLIWRELYVLLGAAAATTARVILGTGVTNPITRHASVTASALVTLDELARGRIIAGFGSGDSAVAVIGARRAPLEALERTIQDVRALAEGREVASQAANMRMTFGGPGKCPPIVIGASGPRMLELAGRIGDGVIITRQARTGTTLTAMLDRVQDGRRQGGPVERPFRTCLSAPVAVHPDRTPAIHAVRPHVASTLRARIHWQLPPAAADARARITAAYDMYQHMDPEATHAALVPDDVVTDFAIAGTAGECIRQTLDLFAAGIDEITIRPYGIHGGARAATMQRFAEDVMAPVLDRLRQPVPAPVASDRDERRGPDGL